MSSSAPPPLDPLTLARSELLDLERAAVQRLGKLAVAAGLGDVKISDRELTRELAALAGRFPGRRQKPSLDKARPQARPGRAPRSQNGP